VAAHDRPPALNLRRKTVLRSPEQQEVTLRCIALALQARHECGNLIDTARSIHGFVTRADDVPAADSSNPRDTL
jgi:hypothetical protein